MWEKCPNTLKNESKIAPDLCSWQYIRHSFILSVWEVKFYMTGAWIFFTYNKYFYWNYIINMNMNMNRYKLYYLRLKFTFICKI